MIAIEPQTLIILAPLVTALVEIAKRTGLPARFAPLAAVIAGIAIVAIASDWNTLSYQAIVLTGIATGAAASGIYSYAKSGGPLAPSQ